MVSALELGTELKLGKNTLATDGSRQAADAPDPRLRPPAEEQRRGRERGALGHDHARPAEPGQGGDGDHVAAARPQGRASRATAWTRSTRPTSTAARRSRSRRSSSSRACPINHVVNVTFKGFWRAVNAIGCVYTDVDRDYFNDSAEFTFIDIDPGYQRLCARQALQYVRFRHYDTDLVRSARQQDFLRQMKQQVTYTELISNRDRLVKIFGRNTATDADAAQQVRGAAAAEARGVLRGPADPGDPLRGRDRAELRRGQQRAGEEARPAVPQRPGLAGPARRGAGRAARAQAEAAPAARRPLDRRLRRHRRGRGPGPPGGPGGRGRLAAGASTRRCS